MGVSRRNQQRNGWLIFIVAIIVIVIIKVWPNDEQGGRCEGLPWADVPGVIPAVASYSLYDSLGSNFLSPHESDWEMEFDSTLAAEQYRILSDDKGIHIAYGPNGDLRARATLRQLTLLTTEGAKLPYGVVEDRPAFRHRGVLMDVCRHFFTVDEVKRQLYIMALYKFNVLHWHLTEDQGWRVAAFLLICVCAFLCFAFRVL